MEEWGSVDGVGAGGRGELDGSGGGEWNGVDSGGKGGIGSVVCAGDGSCCEMGVMGGGNHRGDGEGGSES